MPICEVGLRSAWCLAPDLSSGLARMDGAGVGRRPLARTRETGRLLKRLDFDGSDDAQARIWVFDSGGYRRVREGDIGLESQCACDL
jgi:hypothetical protein